jgi:hypothetical protein
MDRDEIKAVLVFYGWAVSASVAVAGVVGAVIVAVLHV